MSVSIESDRVVRNTAPHINNRIANEARRRLAYYRANPAEIPERLSELDSEWDVERALETNASALAFSGIALSVVADRRFLWLPAIVTAFLFQHAVQGWCPPLPLLRRLGYRTMREIEQERESLLQLMSSDERSNGMAAQ